MADLVIAPDVTPQITPQVSSQPAVIDPLKRRPGRPKGSKTQTRPRSPLIEQHIATMLASGTPQHRIAAAMQMDRRAVATITAKPATQELVVALRETIRNSTLYGLQAATDSAYKFLSDTVSARDAKGFQLVANGLANMERTAASASGESRRVDANLSGHVDTNITAEAKALLATFLGVLPADAQE